MRHTALRTTAAGLFAGLFAAAALGQGAPVQTLNNSFDATAPGNPVLEWNQIFIDTLVAAAPPNITGPRLGALVQAAVFDADNGIEQRYTPLFMARRAPDGASPDAAVVAAAYTALVGLFPSQQATLLDPAYAASLEALRERCPKGPRPNAICEKRIQDGIDWGTDVAHAILAMRANDGFSSSYPAFVGGTAIGQWRPTPPAFGPMSAQSLAFTDTFVLASSTQFQPERPRTLGSPVFSSDFNFVPIESMMLVEAPVFRGDHSMLEGGRDLAEPNECVSFLIRRMANPCLQTAFDMYRGGGWVNPPRSHKDQHSKRPKKRQPD